MARHELDLDNYYDCQNKPAILGVCEAEGCDCIIYDDMEHYDFNNELVCVDCVYNYINDKFYKNN